MRRLVPLEKCAALPETCVVRDGLLFIAQPGVPLGWHVLFFGTYEPELREVVAAVLEPGSVAVDVGANVGWHTLWMAEQVGSTGKVMAIEANPSVRRRLEEHVLMNRLDNVVVVPNAVAEQARTLRFFGPGVGDAAAGDGHVVGDEQAGSPGVLEVEARTLDELVETAALTRLDLIKIDVEGFEWPVFQGAGETIRRFRPNVIFEFDRGYTGRGGGDAARLQRYFDELQYRLFALSRGGAASISRESWPECADILAVPLPA